MNRLVLIVFLLTTTSIFADTNPVFDGRKRSEWESMLREQQNPRLRRVALNSLGEIVSQHTIEPTLTREIMALIGRTLKTDAAPSVRLQAAMICNQMAIKLQDRKYNADPNGVIADLTDNLRTEKETDVIREVCVALGRFGTLSKGAANPLTEHLKHKDATIREAAAMSLARIGGEAKGAAPSLIQLLTDSEKPVQNAAIFALGRVQPADANQASMALLALLDPKYELTTRKEVMISLGLIADPTPKTVQAIATRLSDSEVEIRRAAAIALSKFGSGVQIVESELKKACSEDKDKDVRLYTIKALWDGFGDSAKALVPYVIKRLKDDESFDVKMAIIDQLAELGEDGKSAIPALREAQRDPQLKIREAAGLAIRRIEKGKPKEPEKKEPEKKEPEKK